MAWSNSKIFRQMVADALGNTAAIDLDSDTIKAALFNNSITPDQNVSAANSAYNAGQWANTNEVSSSSQWAAGGVALGSKVLDVATSAVVMFDAADTASSSGATIAGTFGCLVYEDTLTTPVADQGICFNYFGGTQSVTAGTFTIVWNANGVFRITL
jgi:hypothetical protein